MAEYSEAVLTIAKRKLMKEFLVGDVDRIVHNDVELAAFQRLTSEQKVEYFERDFNEYLGTEEGKAKLEAVAGGIDEGAYYERTSDEIAEEELRDRWDIARLENYANDHRLNPNNRSTQSPAAIFDSSIYRETDAAKKENMQYNIDMQYDNYRKEWKGGEADFKKLKAEIEERATTFDGNVDEFIAEHKPFKKRARNRAILWTSLGVVGLAIGIFTIPATIAVLGSAAAAAGALSIGVPAIGFGGAFSALGAANIVKYVRYSRLFRHLKRVSTRTDSNDVSINRQMLNKSLSIVHKMAYKLGITKKELPASPIISSYVDDYKPLSVRLLNATIGALSTSKNAVRYVVAPTEEQKQVKAAKSVVRKTARDTKAAKRDSERAEERAKISDDNIAEMEKLIAERKAAEPKLQAEAKKKRMDAALANLRNDTAQYNVGYAKRQTKGRTRAVIRAKLASGKAVNELNKAENAVRDAEASIQRNRMDIEQGEKRLENLKKNNPKYKEDAEAKKAKLDETQKHEDDARAELARALKKTK